MRWVELGLVAMAVALIAGCGGDAYESQFNASLKSLKDTGQPLQRSMQIVPPSPEAAAEIEKIKGTWRATSVQMDGAEQPQYVQRGMVTIFTDATMITGLSDDPATKKTSSYRLDPTKNPKEIDLSGSESSKGIYQLDGDTLRICTSPTDRPAAFATKQGDGLGLVVLKRAQGEEK
jgi:uncharacterized protein (TIGR03067 family)